MKKKLSPDALDLLTVATITGWPLRGNDLPAIAELVTAGHVTAEEDGISIMISPTTSGVRAVLKAKAVTQDGTKFALADGVETVRSYVRAGKPQFNAPLRVVEPAKPDPFKEGMDAAIAGGGSLTPSYASDSLEAADWEAGFQAGLTAKKQGIV